MANKTKMTEKELDVVIAEQEDEINDAVCDMWAAKMWSQGLHADCATKELLATKLKHEMAAGNLIVDCEIDDPNKATPDTRWRLVDPREPLPPWNAKH